MSLIHSTRTAYILITFSHSSLCHFTFLSLFFTIVMLCYLIFFFFFFNDPATPEISPLPLHDALPICRQVVVQVTAGWKPTPAVRIEARWVHVRLTRARDGSRFSTANIPRLKLEYQLSRAVFFRYVGDRKSTRLNSSHSQISYAVFCLK